MAEHIKLTRAEVTQFGKNNDMTLREYKTEKGPIIFSWKVQTRVNDRVAKSPKVFRRCSYFAKTDEDASKIRNLVTKGALIEIEGVTNRKNFDDKETGNKIYYDEIDVCNLVAIQAGEDSSSDSNSDQDLPF